MNILVFGNGLVFTFSHERVLAQSLAELGHKVWLVQSPPFLIDMGKWDFHKNLTIIEIPYSKYNSNSLLLEEKMDLVLGANHTVAHFVADYKDKHNCLGICNFLEFPVHMINGKDTVNYNFDYSQKFYYWLNCALDLDAVIFNTSVSCEEFEKRYRRKAHLVYSSNIGKYDYNYFSAIDKPSSDYIFSCHKLVQSKGTDYLLMAIKKLGIDYKHVYGLSMKEHKMNIEAMASNMDPKVSFYPYASERKKMELCYHCNLVVYPQILEWIAGQSIIDGFSMKKPGVVFDYPIYKELYGDCVLYAERRSVVDLRGKIKELYFDKDMNREMGERAYQRYLDNFTPKIMAERILDVANQYITCD